MKYGFHNTAEIGKPMKVFLDGREIENVYECDTEEGYAVIAVLDDSGDIVLDGGGIATAKVTGKITVSPIRN